MIKRVTFSSPGTFYCEKSSRKLQATTWQSLVELAVEEAKDIVERHNAIPYGFSIEDQDGTFYLPHMKKVLVEDIPVTPDNGILLSNCFNNSWSAIVQSTIGWASSIPFDEKCDKLIAREELADGTIQYTVHMPNRHTWIGK